MQEQNNDRTATVLESGIEVWQQINVGPWNFGKNDKSRPWINKDRENLAYADQKIYSLKIFLAFIPKFDKRRDFNNALGPGKNSKINKHRP